MPRRKDIKSILIIGSGPIVIGQACEFDYSGTQACRVLRSEGYRIILANSNPATIMTDPDFADATYIEPLTVEVLEQIIASEKPDVILPTLGGQTALNLAMQLHERGILDTYGVKLIGASPEAIAVAEDRSQFKEAMQEIGLQVARSGVAKNMTEAERVITEIGLPVIIRPAYILGGQGTGIASTMAEFRRLAANGLDASPISEILIEQSIAGWKEFELEVMRDNRDNCVVICSIENVDAMGVHTGDSITVAPAQTLSDKEYQQMRDAAFACLRRVGVETGGSNVQFAVNPKTGEQVVIEMNPRVSRSSALASKATGFPIAKIAALLAVGYSLDEITNDITKQTPASFEPVIDYVVTKIPRWTFEKFPGASGVLGTQMQSVGEVMAIGRTFPESLQKALRSLERGYGGLNAGPSEKELDRQSASELLEAVRTPTSTRLQRIESLLRRGIPVDKIANQSGYDPWFLYQIKRISEARNRYAKTKLKDLGFNELKHLKQLGFSDAQLGYLFRAKRSDVRSRREELGIYPTYKRVDTCSAEFAADTPYCYSTWEDETEITADSKKKIIILGSGPNRIGQGIEFDYTCVHASFACAEANVQSIMYNCNPETVSTDYDVSDRLYFEPLTIEDVEHVIDLEKPDGIIVSLGGQTPLKLANELPADLIFGTSPKCIDRAEDRDSWNQLCQTLRIPQPPGGTATELKGALTIAGGVGYPVLIRPSYVLGGRAMRIVYTSEELRAAFAELSEESGLTTERPVLIDHFMEGATEIDLDAIRDQTGKVAVAGILEHIEQTGVHSGDSACTLPTQTLPAATIKRLIRYAQIIADELSVVGLINIQFAVKGTEIYVIEANPRASRTVPFVAKAIGLPIARIATRVMLGESLEQLATIYKFRIDRTRQLKSTDTKQTPLVAVKESVFPFNRFDNADVMLGPEMKSTGEVMGRGQTFGEAFAKAQTSAGTALPTRGTVLITVADRLKRPMLAVANRLSELGFDLAATSGTAEFLTRHTVKVARVAAKIGEKKGEDIIKLIESGETGLVINIPDATADALEDGYRTRRAALEARVPTITTLAAAQAALMAIESLNKREITALKLQK